MVKRYRKKSSISLIASVTRKLYCRDLPAFTALGIAPSRADRGQKVRRTSVHWQYLVGPHFQHIFFGTRRVLAKRKPHHFFPLPFSSLFSSPILPSPSLSLSLFSSFPFFTHSQWVLSQTVRSLALSFSPPSRLVRVTPIRLREFSPISVFRSQFRETNM